MILEIKTKNQISLRTKISCFEKEIIMIAFARNESNFNSRIYNSSSIFKSMLPGVTKTVEISLTFQN